VKASRPTNPSGNRLVELQGDELEELIEVDGPVEQFAETQALHAQSASIPSVPQYSQQNSPQSGHRTGPGSADFPDTPPARRSNAYAVPVSSMHKAKTASLGPRGRSAGRRPREMPDDIDEMLGMVLGSYRILSLIGEGGMGRVYHAEHVKLGRKVALKLLRPEYAVKRDAVGRFFQEARAVNQIGHENIVDITDFVELDSGETYIIMELLHGDDLADIQRQSDQPMPLHRAMQISLQVCDALEAAHKSGIIHRDLKPDNIFIVNHDSRRDYVKLLDFGVAKLLGNEDSQDGWKTAAGSVIGTPAYMSPEQASGIPVDHRSDIYSLGAILYELFTGHPVFRAKSFGEFVVKHMNHDPIPPRELADAPSIPSALEAVILRCLEKDPARRYQSVVELREDLARATATVETVIRVNPLQTRRPSRTRSRRGLMVTLVVLGVGVLAGVAFFVAADLRVDDVTAGPVGGQVPSRKATDADEPSTVGRVVTAKLTLRSNPGGAEVFRSDDLNNSLGKTPLELRLENIGEEVRFVFRLPGYRDTDAKVHVVDNTLIGVDLEELPRGTTPVTNPLPRPHRPRVRPASKGKGKRPLTHDDTDPVKPAPKKPAPKRINPEDTVDPFNP